MTTSIEKPVIIKDLVLNDVVLNTTFRRRKISWYPFGQTGESFTVVRDGHHPVTGKRIHVVAEDTNPRNIANALVISEKDYYNILDI